jgi:hypothetical protein
VKDGLYECVECGDALPERWSFERTLARRAVLRRGAVVWTVDTIEEASSSDQDRVALRVHDDHLVIVLADGAGGITGGAEAAERVVTALSGAALTGADDAVRAVGGIDLVLAQRTGGEATAVLARVGWRGPSSFVVVGASVGDSTAWARVDGRWCDLTELQNRRPFVGSGRARPARFLPTGAADALLVASDGLATYAAWSDVLALLDEGPGEWPWRLVDLARLPSGGLSDDVSAVVVRRVSTGS